MTQSAESWNSYLDKHGPAMVLLARQWVPSHADAEDVVHDAFVRFWPARNRVQDPAAFLFVCVKRCAMDWLRARNRRQHHQNVAGEMTANCSSLFQTRLEQDEDRQRVERHLANLPPPQREVIVLHLWADLTFQQIGVVAGVSVNTAASRYRYALEALRGAMQQELDR
ncbi:MAG: sigma-70 family RNA polymerase sigma factor [Phycisphaeraceae bacterium]|nr:sigma-70 family RNA polymerase sigma factor [Phycisphaeraceae bacterium]